MTSIVANKFKEHIGSQFIESITEPANSIYYIAASKHTSYSGGDATVPTPTDNVTELEISPYQQIVFGKKVTSSDISLLIPKHTWSSGTVYDHYDQDDGELFNKSFYVAVDAGATYYVYKCLDNNRGANSTVQPSSTSESACNFITTADGYTWKLMYKLTESDFEKFATADYMPVQTSANVSGNTISGAIDVIRISNTGSNYIATLDGQFQVDDLREAIPSYSGNNTTYRLSTSASSNSDFYVGSAIYISSGTGSGQIREITDYDAGNRVAVVNNAFTVAPSSDSTYKIAPNVAVTGDGSNTSAYATVSSNSSVNNFISKINIVSRGSNFTYATATVTGNTGGISNNAVLKVVIPPTGGHGYDAPTELGSRDVGISVSFNTNESGYISIENDYRKFILLKDPLFNSVNITLSNENGTFTSGETVYQIDSKILTGTVSGNTSSNTLTGVGTDLANSLKVNDYITVTDTVTNTYNLRTVSSITNATSIVINDELSFITSSAKIAHVSITATGKKSGNTSPYITLANAEPKFQTSKVIIGASSGAVATISSIDVNEKNYNNWLTFDNRTRISYTGSVGVVPEDAQLFQTDVSLSNAYYHSSNATFVFLTEEKGTINADPNENLEMVSGSNNFTLGSTKYNPDLVKGSGKVLYIENNDPISRSISQSETIRLVLEF